MRSLHPLQQAAWEAHNSSVVSERFPNMSLLFNGQAKDWAKGVAMIRQIHQLLAGSVHNVDELLPT
jgi:hypothetical protein